MKPRFRKNLGFKRKTGTELEGFEPSSDGVKVRTVV